MLCSSLRGFTPTHITPVLKSSWFYTHAYNPSTVRLVLLSRGWSLATITCVKLSVGPITHVENCIQVHKSWRTGSCLPFGNCKCYYLYFVKCYSCLFAVLLHLFCHCFVQKVISTDHPCNKGDFALVRDL